MHCSMESQTNDNVDSSFSNPFYVLLLLFFFLYSHHLPRWMQISLSLPAGTVQPTVHSSTIVMVSLPLLLSSPPPFLPSLALADSLTRHTHGFFLADHVTHLLVVCHQQKTILLCIFNSPSPFCIVVCVFISLFLL